MINPTDVETALQRLLETVHEALDDAPDGRVVHGAFAHDCAMVAVRLAGWRFEGNACAVIPVLTFEALWLRCYPAVENGALPTGAEISTAALLLAGDVEPVANAVGDLIEGDGLYPGRCCDDVDWTPGFTSVGPEGGLAGWRLNVDVRL